MIIAVDFDGTIVEHTYPTIGPDVPGAFEWLREFSDAGHQLILWTMRSGPELAEAVEHCRRNGVEFWGVNRNPGQGSWTESPKAYAQMYIDDAALGCPLVLRLEGRPYVDWSAVGPMVEGLSRPAIIGSGS